LASYQHCDNVKSDTCLHASSKSSRAERAASRKQSLKQRLGMTDKEITKVIGSHNLLLYTEENMDITLDCLKQNLKADQETLNKIVKNCPNILAYRPTTLESKITWYKQQFGWSEKELLKTMSFYPLLSFSIEENVEPKSRWLKSTFNLTDAQLSKVVKKTPRILDNSIHHLEDSHSWLRATLGHNSMAAKQKLFLRAPRLLRCTTKNMQARFCWLQDEFNFTESELAKVL
jgi:hypothetical protein